ncbi:hypothetical protein Hanom_Chr14g01325101 [Helianthus anomalus]
MQTQKPKIKAIHFNHRHHRHRRATPASTGTSNNGHHRHRRAPPTSTDTTGIDGHHRHRRAPPASTGTTDIDVQTTTITTIVHRQPQHQHQHQRSGHQHHRSGHQQPQTTNWSLLPPNRSSLSSLLSHSIFFNFLLPLFILPDLKIHSKNKKDLLLSSNNIDDQRISLSLSLYDVQQHSGHRCVEGHLKKMKVI